MTTLGRLRATLITLAAKRLGPEWAKAPLVAGYKFRRMESYLGQAAQLYPDYLADPATHGANYLAIQEDAILARADFIDYMREVLGIDLLMNHKPQRPETWKQGKITVTNTDTGESTVTDVTYKATSAIIPPLNYPFPVAPTPDPVPQIDADTPPIPNP